jgi:hypothetical protein
MTWKKTQTMAEKNTGRLCGPFQRKHSKTIGYGRSILAAALLALCVTLWPGAQAYAHGSAPIDEDSCARFMGENIIHFSAYQPQFDKAGHYCEEIPRVGDTIVVVDLYNKRLRQVPVSLKIIDPSAAETEQVMVAIEPKVYIHGVIEAATSFPRSGTYKAIITVADGDEMQRSYTIRVEPSKLMSYVTAGLTYGVMMILLGFLIGRPLWNYVQNRRGAS